MEIRGEAVGEVMGGDREVVVVEWACTMGELWGCLADRGINNPAFFHFMGHFQAGFLH